MTDLAAAICLPQPAPCFFDPRGAQRALRGKCVDAPTTTADGPGRFDADLEQMLRIAAGDQVALGEAYDAHHRAVRACARRLVGDDSAAEDLVHDAFVSLPRAARNFRGQSSARTFIISVALNHSRHHLRASRRRRAATARFATEPRVSAPEQHAHVSDQELARALVRALDTLPDDQRAAFVLCMVEERDSHEVATLVGAPAATVRTRLFHARRKLRRELSTLHPC